jgi:5-methylthioadenosine/S-adenosylhomocysteine deaminase
MDNGSLPRTLLRGGTVLTAEKRGTEERICDVLIEGSKIVALRPDLAVDAASCEIIDAAGKVICPGFVDTHRHLWQSPFRYFGADWLIAHYAKAMWGMAGPVYTPDDLYVSIRIGLADALNAGVTQVFDWNHNVISPEHADATVRAHKNSGARVVFGYGQGTPVWAEMLDPKIGTSRGLPSADLARVKREYYSASDGLLTLALAARGPEVSPMSVVAAEARQAQELDLRSSIHIGNGAWAEKKPVKMMHEANLLEDRITWVHCNTLSDLELKLIADSGGTASVATELELHMGHGHPAISRLLKFGVRPSLSVDTCTNVSGDLFAIMRATLSAARGDSNREIIATGVMPTEVVLSTADVLEFATLQGARANGLGDRTGSLAVGKQADIVVINTDAPNLIPLNYASGAVVMGAHAGNVEMVLVDGRFVKRDFRLVDLDLAHLKRRAEGLRDSLFERIGAKTGRWFPPLN